MSEKAITSLRVIEEFTSIQGEGRYLGQPSYFIRFRNCNLIDVCPLKCDTKYLMLTAPDIEVPFESIYLDTMKHKHLVITGGEPTLYNKEIVSLIEFIIHQIIIDLAQNINESLNSNLNQIQHALKCLTRDLRVPVTNTYNLTRKVLPLIEIETNGSGLIKLSEMLHELLTNGFNQLPYHVVYVPRDFIHFNFSPKLGYHSDKYIVEKYQSLVENGFYNTDIKLVISHDMKDEAFKCLKSVVQTIPVNRVWLMPHGTTHEEMTYNLQLCNSLSKILGVNITPRLHFLCGAR